MPEPLPPESHYNPKLLDKIFAAVAVILLISIIGLFAKDYSRQWKNYQREFRALEVEKSRVKLDEQENLLKGNEEYQDILKKLEEVTKTLSAKAPQSNAIATRLSAAQAVERLHTQQYQFSKAKYDALKYQFESAADKKASNAQQFKINLENLSTRLQKLSVLVEVDKHTTKGIEQELNDAQKAYKSIDKQRLNLAKKKEILEKKLKRIDIAEMSAMNQLAEMVRDLPIIDLANPNYKIRQIVLKDIPEDVNFMKVPRVDRCTTCHLGIDNPDFKEAAQPYRTHPNLELYMDKNSPHPLDQFACTTCHGGRGRATDFTAAAHTPRNEEQASEWKKKYGWHELEHWEHPILPLQYTQAGCFKCHQDQGSIKGAEKLNLGLTLIERAGCYGCHNVNKYASWPKSGPNLEYVSSKLTKDWTYHWIENPKAIRHNAWMPSYFNQTNNSDPVSIERSKQEINALVEFLFGNSKKFSVDALSQKGDSKNGKELVASLGCLGCHQITKDKPSEPRTPDSLHREFGPNLIGLGSKTTQAWLYQWLKDPKRYHETSRMPSLRLSDQEAADIAAFLIQDKDANSVKPRPALNETVLNEIVMDFLKKSESVADAQAKLATMDKTAKQKFAGQRLVREYGCFACHKIPGFENEKPIGVDLSEEGSKSIERLDFGFVKIEHSKHAWFKQKLLDPRIFDHGRVLSPLERNRMPNFNLTQDEADALTTLILGLVKDKPNQNKMPNTSVKAAFVTQGQRTIRQLNCQGCHMIEGQGGGVQSTVEDWLVHYQNKDVNEAKAISRSFSPPNLIGEGAKIQAQWMFEFFHEPIAIRPWLKIRMPSYNFHQGQENTLIKYFNYYDDQEFPFTEIYHADLSKEDYASAEKLFSKEVFNCAQCHIIGSKHPDGAPENWAPDLSLASERLKPDWIIKWITNPPALLPGTKMPVFYDPKAFETSGPPDIFGGDSNRQIRALRDYVLSITADPQPTKSHDPVPEASKDAPVK